MKWLHVVTIAMLVWGNLAFASLPSASDSAAQEHEVITSWTAHLNFYHNDLQVSPKANLDMGNPAVRDQVREDLRQLENVMFGDQSIAPSSLKTLECTNVVCGDGPPGHCSACTVNGFGGSK